ncbi:Cucumisin-like [Quillaja saponaria]|uniref:Cucumisin-like n=1 Tax=Quillaja saponaria TaxID=32244 RepID=A0AAD7Q676_QUISA|nr:Cucumisin-like [Quillaja saponaria]
MDPQKHEIKREFAYDSGLLNPVKAIDPGLVFNASGPDYNSFLCKQGYNTTTRRLITGDHSVCRSTKTGRAWNLNYPSLSLAIEDGQKIKGNFFRTVTNVGPSNSSYYMTYSMPNILKDTVRPSVISFSNVNETKSFTVQVRGAQISQVPIISGSITWRDRVHEVKIPLVLYTVMPPVLHNNPLRVQQTST